MSGLRVLCLHGYHGSGAILRDQMLPLTAALPATIEFAYVDAPSLATGDFGWWHQGFDGWERTRDWAIELMCAGPEYDGVFGFSQGAALAGLLTAVAGSGNAPPGFRVGFAIMAGGFTSDLPQHADLLRHPLTTPSVHIIGRTDVIVPRKDSLRLASRFADPLIIEHPGGHIVPGHDAVAGPVAEFLASRKRPGPGTGR
jgi:pimeloyl-ACP methyl ester carboxylesterase